MFMYLVNFFIRSGGDGDPVTLKVQILFYLEPGQQTTWSFVRRPSVIRPLSARPSLACYVSS